MKFSEFPYERPNYEQVMSEISALTEKFRNASSAAEQLAVMKELEQLRIRVMTAQTICSIRYTVDTRDKFYSEEYEYNESMSPVLQEKLQEFNTVLFHSPFRAEIEKE